MKFKFFPFYLLSLLPMRILYWLSDLIYLVVYRGIGYRRNVVRENLKNAFPDTSRQDLLDIEKKFYRHFCEVAVEAIKTLTISEKQVKKRLVIRNPELLRDLLEKGQSILMYTAHQGNWEWLVYLPLYFDYTSYTFYRPLQNTYFNELFLLMRERFGVICVESNKGYRTILKQDRKNSPVMNCVIGDQSPKSSDAKQWTHFMHRETAFFVGAERIAEKTDSTVIFPSFIQVKRGRYELQLEVVEKKYGEHGNFSFINGYAELLEKAIIRQPELWLWSHRRWKLSTSASNDQPTNKK
ncbi:lysophospholipid acyltransferase family protein [Pricia sp. S334]|uniref:Lysophospholipid acyltransferase family protein n=1 Tax=Pricia mediterranea TaxID=3076079 RepID=A0ABU3LAW6_9FLAO|nr:lysophospholipid acyltransferase family protein [Pricia sp. S334]MDT7830232.1 lysophospholipid acyltransferase family protein [Pricia sp. S334]